jgi:hypothetical protein
MGDIHWVLLKLQSWLSMQKATATADVLEFDRRPRSMEFLRRIPFLRCGSYDISNVKALGPEFDASYHHGTKDVHPGYRGYDAYFCFNGSLLTGKDMHQILPDCSTDWNYPITELAEDKQFRAEFYAKYGKYILLFFSQFGVFERWARYMTVQRFNGLLAQLAVEFPYHKLVLTGSAWDLGISSAVKAPVINMIGRTSLGQFLSLIRGAGAFVGYPGGNTIISAHFGIPTVIIWESFYKHPKFRTNWGNPRFVGKTHQSLELEGATDRDIIKALATSMSWVGRG